MNISQAIKNRASTRAFLDKPVSQEVIKSVIDIARWAPSGANLQPWRVVVVTGNTKRQISEEIIDARGKELNEHPEYQYYPEEWFEPYKSRRYKTGLALYSALNIGREDKDKRQEVWNKNYHFFDAPVGLLFFLDKRMGQGALVDMGIFLQSIMLAALEFNLATCPQASIADYPDVVRKILCIDENELLLAGMALGYADMSNPINRYRTERESVEKILTFYD